MASLSKGAFYALNITLAVWLCSLKKRSRSRSQTHMEQCSQCVNGRGVYLTDISSVYGDEGIKDRGWISHYHSQEIKHVSRIHSDAHMCAHTHKLGAAVGLCDS